MSNPAVPAQRQQRFVLRSAPPLKSYFLASLYTLSGALLLVFSLRGAWKLGFVIFAWGLIAFGAILAVVAWYVHSRLQTTLLLDTDTLTLVNPGRKRVLAWSSIDEVGIAGPRLVFTRKDAGRRHVVVFSPKQTNQGLFTEMLEMMQRYLDASRGYGR